MRVRKIRGIGPLMSRRLMTSYNIQTTLQLRTFLLGIINESKLSRNQKKKRLEEFVNNLTRNPRFGNCLEGNQPRIHNQMARDALIRFMMIDMKMDPRLKPRFYNRSRKPPKPTSPSPRYDHRLIIPYGISDQHPPFEGGAAFPHGPTTPNKEGVHPPSLPFSKSQGFPPGLTRAQRDAWIRNLGDLHHNRQFWPCTCFQTKDTCQDFSPSRRNRRLDTTLPSCEWTGRKCRDFTRRRSKRLQSKLR